MLGKLAGMGRDYAIKNACLQMLSHVYEYDFGSEYEYEISVRMIVIVAHLLIICLAFDYHWLCNISYLRDAGYGVSSCPCLIT